MFVVAGIFVFIFMIGFVLGAPEIQILSPENISYNSTKVLVNVSSNEVVEFFVKYGRTGIIEVLDTNVDSFETYLYIKAGSYDFEIFANNSRGVVNKSVTFSGLEHNPINVTSCGFLSSSDTAYILTEDISTEGSTCLWMVDKRNISFDLNGNTINAGSRRGFQIFSSADVDVYNGKIIGVILLLEDLNLGFCKSQELDLILRI